MIPRRAVQMLLEDEEWSKWSDREIARRCGVGSDMVGALRKSSIGNRQIEKTVERNGTTYKQNTQNIGRRSAEETQHDRQKN